MGFILVDAKIPPYFRLPKHLLMFFCFSLRKL